MPGRLFKIMAKRKGERLSEGRRLINGGGAGGALLKFSFQRSVALNRLSPF